MRIQKDGPTPYHQWPQHAACHQLLVVIGGNCGNYRTNFSLKVEILDTTESVQWYQAASFPQPCQQVPFAVIGNMCFLLGGYTEGAKVTKKVFCVCLDDLISQAVSQSASASAPPTPSPWLSLPDIPQTLSTALAFNGALLAVGGAVNESSAIHIYLPSSNSWVMAGKLPTMVQWLHCSTQWRSACWRWFGWNTSNVRNSINSVNASLHHICLYCVIINQV